MASLHRARKSTVQIVRTAVVAAKNAKRPATLEYIVRCHCCALLRRVFV